MNAKGVLAGICLFLSHAVFSMNAEFAHQLIIEQSPELLGEGDQLVSVYYFGQSESMTVVGLERVSDDFLPIRWLVIIKNKSVLGWYYPSDEFPVRFDNGRLSFPKGSGISDVNLLPLPPMVIDHTDHQIPFYSRRAFSEASPPN